MPRHVCRNRYTECILPLYFPVTLSFRLSRNARGSPSWGESGLLLDRSQKTHRVGLLLCLFKSLKLRQGYRCSPCRS